jgi:MerR family redox-sensitive transcriptional activator SoxR
MQEQRQQQSPDSKRRIRCQELPHRLVAATHSTRRMLPVTQDLRANSFFSFTSPSYTRYNAIINLKVNFKSRGVFMVGLSIGQMAAKADLNASTIRYYESVGLLPSPERKNGHRRYDEGLLDRINFIKVAQQTGFSIQEITVLLEGFEANDSLSERWEQMAKQKRSVLEERKKQINSMIQILDNGLSCKCLTWSECNEKIQNIGTC